MSASTPLYVDVYVHPIIAAATSSRASAPDPLKGWWSPTSSALIHTDKEAVIVDTSISIAQTEAFADWIDNIIQNRKTVKYFFATHAHPDHFFGFPALKKRYPGVKPVATKHVVEGARTMYGEGMIKLWEGLFPGQIETSTPPEWEALPENNEFHIGGHVLKAYDVQHGDCAAGNSFLFVPDLGLICAGDLVYGDCYQYFGEANTQEKRAHWTAAVEHIESLKPSIVVPGHSRASQVPGPYLCGQTKEYIGTFERELEKASSAQELEDRMIELYPERWNRFILQMSCQNSFAARATS